MCSRVMSGLSMGPEPPDCAAPFLASAWPACVIQMENEPAPATLGLDYKARSDDTLSFSTP